MGAFDLTFLFQIESTENKVYGHSAILLGDKKNTVQNLLDIHYYLVLKQWHVVIMHYSSSSDVYLQNKYVVNMKY